MNGLDMAFKYLADCTIKILMYQNINSFVHTDVTLSQQVKFLFEKEILLQLTPQKNGLQSVRFKHAVYKSVSLTL